MPSLWITWLVGTEKKTTGLRDSLRRLQTVLFEKAVDLQRIKRRSEQIVETKATALKGILWKPMKGRTSKKKRDLTM